MACQLCLEKIDRETLGIKQRYSQHKAFEFPKCMAIKTHIGILEDKRD